MKTPHHNDRSVGIRRRYMDQLRSRGSVRPQICRLVDRAYLHFDRSESFVEPTTWTGSIEKTGKSNREVWTVASVDLDTHEKLKEMSEARNVSMASIVESLVVVDLYRSKR